MPWEESWDAEEVREKRKLRKLVEDEQSKLQERFRKTTHLAQEFYSQWVREHEQVTDFDMLMLFDRAWRAAQTFVDGVDNKKPEGSEAE